LLTKKATMKTSFGRPLRSAYTILEMLLVITVIVMATGLIVASIDGIREAYRLPRTTDDIRAILAGLRARAMDEATTYEFSFEPDTAKYRIRKSGGDAGGSHGPPSDVDVDPMSRIEFDQDDVLGEHELPAGLTLLEGRGDGSRTTASMQTGEETDANRKSLRFLPDGSTTGLAFILKDAGGGEVHFHVRGLTGTVKTARKGADGRDVPP
jgi:hypothetical protein